MARGQTPRCPAGQPESRGGDGGDGGGASGGGDGGGDGSPPTAAAAAMAAAPAVPAAQALEAQRRRRRSAAARALVPCYPTGQQSGYGGARAFATSTCPLKTGLYLLLGTPQSPHWGS